MFREMRRIKQLLTERECMEILEKSSSGVLALLGDDDYPYAVPMSYVFEDGKIYFHSAVNGHKIDAVKKHSKASFCVISEDNIMESEYTTYYKSVIVFGKIRVVETDEEKTEAITKLALRYSPNESEDSRTYEIKRTYNSFLIIELTAEHITGKQAKELAQINRQEVT